MTTIEDYMFSGCSNLTSIDLPNTVKKIGNEAFKYCTGLTSITIPDSVTTIEAAAFAYCSSLTNITIGRSVQTIDFSAFDNCDALKTVFFNARCCEGWDWLEGFSPFVNCHLEELVFGNEVGYIPAGIAYGQSLLTNIKIPNSVWCIGDHAFRECGLTNINIPNSVQEIGIYAFLGCSFTSITIPESVHSIGHGAFNCGGIHKLIFNAINCGIGYPISGDDWPSGCFAMCPLETIVIGDKVTVIPNLFVHYNDSLSTIICYPTTPPICYDRSFDDYSSTLHVPPTSLAAYFTAPYWQNFTEIIGDAVKPVGLNLNIDSAELVIGETLALSAMVTPFNAIPNDIVWLSENPSVANIDNGIVTAVNTGECDIRATCLDKEVVCHIVVYGYRIMLDQYEAQLLPNHLLKLTPTSTSEELSSLVVISSDPNVAATRVINGSVQVVGIKEGTATITVGSIDGTAIPATCLITVYTEPGDLNCDGFTNISDVTQIIDYLLSGDASNIKLENADVNADGNINISDVTTLIDKLLSGNQQIA